MRNSINHLRKESWQRLIFYGEAFSFVVAWVVGVVMLVQVANSENEISNTPGIDAFAEVSLTDIEDDPLK